MAELHCSDGKVINISKETEKELREVFSEPEWKFGDIIVSKSVLKGLSKGIVLYNGNGELRGFLVDCKDFGHTRGITLEYLRDHKYVKNGNIFEEK